MDPIDASPVRDDKPMLVQCLPSVCDAGQALNQQWTPPSSRQRLQLNDPPISAVSGSRGKRCSWEGRALPLIPTYPGGSNGVRQWWKCPCFTDKYWLAPWANWSFACRCKKEQWFFAHWKPALYMQKKNHANGAAGQCLYQELLRSWL